MHNTYFSQFHKGMDASEVLDLARKAVGMLEARLRSVDPFFQRPDAKVLISRMQLVEFARGAVVTCRNTHHREARVMLVLKGHIGVLPEQPKDGDVWQHSAVPVRVGEFCGVDECFGPEPSHGLAIAEDDVVVAAMPIRAIDDLHAIDPRLASAFLRCLIAEMAARQQQVMRRWRDAAEWLRLSVPVIPAT